MKTISVAKQGALFAVLSGLMYGLIGYFGITLMRDLSIANMQFWRFLISALFVMAFFAKDCFKSKDSIIAMVYSFCFGGLFYGTAAGVYFIGSSYIGTGPSMVIFFTYPAIVLLLNKVIYKTKIPKIYFFALLLIAVGMTQLVGFEGFKLDYIGIFLAIFSAFLYACYILCGDNIQISPAMSTLMVSLGCAFASLIYALWDQSFIIPTTQVQWLKILGIGVISTALPMILFLEALKRISPEKASILSVTEPLFVVIFGVLLLDEFINIPKMVGIVAILLGALITLISKKQAIPNEGIA